MWASKNKHTTIPKQANGFTIVELLIVIVVIAILAAITIVAYNGIQDRAKNSTAQSDLANFAKKIEVVKVDASDGLYPASLTSSMDIRGSKSVYAVTRNNWYYCVSTDRTQYALGVALTNAGAGYFMSSVNGLQASTNVADATTCPIVGKASGSQMGHVWNGTSGSWSSWVN
ncbi:type II secretion system protein [Paenarthrobacter sp. JL.01a]|uniref:type II secretion system protein n=1 Tax=Paenarthrobacter sp. JL.01a TaxID=2979324 RepID=UPI0021CA80C7|nr:prepilin-type N-terminal cleavage/methylation domain-containing protein [Paenarthrobacter sp. JL.01a]UXM91018.1 prepilin-type N-terminal cleavage/methylation domain-containing protein [Paenarthrobacter sp. JL.01a]